jgi:hypothetical protein
MKCSFKIWFSVAVVAGAVALALYARPRAYQVSLPEPKPASAYPASPGDPPAQGRIVGRVVWKADLPQVPNVEGMMGNIGAGPVWTSIPNPAAPRIDPQSHGIADAVVFLKDVRPPVKPWPHPSLSIRVTENRIALVQRESQASIGFVPVGTEVGIESQDTGYQMLRARGASFFTMPLPRPNQPQKRMFGTAGHIALTSGIGQIASRADLFVCEHPYFTATDTLGRFELTGVPPGEYEIVAWLKNWTIASHDRDPETGKILRLNSEPPITAAARVRVVEGSPANIELGLP